MSVSFPKSNQFVSRFTQQNSVSGLGGTQKASCQAGEKRLAQPRGMQALQQDSFEAGSGKNSQLQKLLQSTESLLKTVVALEQMLEQSQAGGTSSAGGAPSVGGTSPAGGAEAGASPSSTGSSSAAPGSSSPAPVELNPTGSSSSSSATPSGDAKLGPGMPPALSQYKGAIEDAAAKAGVPAAMIAGQIWQESRGNLAAVSTNGGNGLTDTGLMQVNPNTFKELQAKHPELQGKNLSDPATNIMAGAFYMKDMKDQFGSWDLALRAYNSGPNGVDKSNPNAIPAGTGDATYVQKVKQFWDTISTGQGSLPA